MKYGVLCWEISFGWHLYEKMSPKHKDFLKKNIKIKIEGQKGVYFEK